MSAMFQQLEGETAVLRQAGVFTVADLYTRNDGELFAAVGKGRFVRLYADGATSKPHVVLDTLQLDGELTKDQFGKLCVGPGPKRKPLEERPSWLALEDRSGVE